MLRRHFFFVAVVGLLAFEPPAIAQRNRPARLKAHRPAVTGVHGLVTSGHSLASVAGMRILLEGGNAADASVAVLATLNVTEPMMSGAGGNGFMTIFDPDSKRVHSLNATGAAPLKTEPGKITAEELSRGMKAGVVPGLFGGWLALLDRFGTKSLAEVLAPAIEYAENGHPIDPYVARSIAGQKELFERFPTTARIFLPDGKPPEAGQMLKNPDLAKTFKRLAAAEQEALKKGKTRSESLQAAFDQFYKGEIAREFARFYEQNGGLFTAEDLAKYQPTWTSPVRTNYRGFDVYSSPPTSRGGLEVVMQLNLIEGYDVKKLGHNTPKTLHLIAECIKLAKSDIYHYIADPKGDPHRSSKTIAAMISEDYAARRRAVIDRKQAMVYPNHGDPRGMQTSFHPASQTPLKVASRLKEDSVPGCTTSFSVVDDSGFVVACTPTLGSLWGTGVIVGETGLFFNNGSRIGSTSPYPDDVNYVKGGQIPLLNNSPIIVMQDGKFVLSLGTPGGETIGQTQFQVLLNILDFEMGIQEAIEAPRMALVAEPNFYKPAAKIKMRVEGRIPRRVVGKLEQMGHDPVRIAEFSLGNMQGILRNRKTGTMSAGADPRRMMYAIGW